MKPLILFMIGFIALLSGVGVTLAETPGVALMALAPLLLNIFLISWLRRIK